MSSCRNRARASLWLALAAAVLMLGNGCSRRNEESSGAGSSAQGKANATGRRQAPDFTLKDLAGNSVSLSGFRGKVVILDFWATWCPPCRAEIPHFVELQRDYQPKGLEIVGVSLDQGGIQVVRPFVQQNGVNYTMLLDGQPVAGLYGGISGIPTTFVLDKQGRVVRTFVGYNEKATFENLVRSLLQES